MKKFGILTFHRADNCGAILQAYALCEILKRIYGENEVEIIDYRCRAIEHSNSVFPLEFGRRFPKSLLRSVLRLPITMRIKKPYRQFRQKHLTISSRTYEKSNIEQAAGQYRNIVVGSDQVWNPFLTGGDTTWFLPFVKDAGRRHSYAASLGSEAAFNKHRNAIAQNLKNFGRISLREPIGKEYFDSSRVAFTRHLDPVFLFPAGHWLSMAAHRTETKPYVLYYEALSAHGLYEAAREYARKNRLKLICISQRLRSYPGSERRFFLSPPDFLAALAGAEMVFTTSFHAVAFSVLLQKPFYSETIDSKGKTNRRVKDLLCAAQMSGRDIALAQIPGGGGAAAPAWEAAGAYIERERASALAYLQQMGDGRG